MASMLLASYHLILEYTPCRYSVLPRVWAPEVTSRKSDHCGPGDVALAAFLVTTGHEKGRTEKDKGFADAEASSRRGV